MSSQMRVWEPTGEGVCCLLQAPAPDSGGECEAFGHPHLAPGSRLGSGGEGLLKPYQENRVWGQYCFVLNACLLPGPAPAFL